MTIAMGWIGLVAGFGIAAGGPIADDRVLTPDEVAQRLSQGPHGVEIDVEADGRVTEVELDRRGDRGDDELEGRIVSVDVGAKTVTVAHLGVVQLGDARELEGLDDRDVARGAWLAAAARAVKQGAPVWIDAEGSYRDDGFWAREVELERSGETTAEGTLTAERFNAKARTVRLGTATIALGDARIELED